MKNRMKDRIETIKEFIKNNRSTVRDIAGISALAAAVPWVTTMRDEYGRKLPLRRSWKRRALYSLLPLGIGAGGIAATADYMAKADARRRIAGLLEKRQDESIASLEKIDKELENLQELRATRGYMRGTSDSDLLNLASAAHAKPPQTPLLFTR